MSLTSFFRCGAALVTAGLLLSAPLQAAERTIDGAFGSVELNGTPQRVVALGENALDAALSLGVKPVGTLISRGGTDVPDYLKEKTGSDISLVGTVREVNLEAVLMLQPDLILASNSLPREQYEKLSLMAPTVVPAVSTFEHWSKTYEVYAEALNQSEQARERIAEIDSRIASLRERMPKDQTVSVVRWNPQGPFVMSSHLFVGQILEGLGFKSNALANELTTKPHTDILSLENISRADADWIFLATLNPDGQKALDAARQQPAFTRLNAVSNDHVVSVDGQVWSSSSGYLAAQHILDDVEKALLK